MLSKRLFDIAASLVGLLLIWWVFPIVAILIRIKMPGGPAFFCQKRVGKDGPRPDVPGYADKLQGADRDVLKLRPGITGPATLKYRLEDEMISAYVAKCQAEGDTRPMQEIATEYNDTIIYPDKVRLNCYYYRHYSFCKDIEMIFATVLGFKVKFAGEMV